MAILQIRKPREISKDVQLSALMGSGHGSHHWVVCLVCLPSTRHHLLICMTVKALLPPKIILFFLL